MKASLGTFLTLLALAAIAVAQPHPVPHVIYIDGAMSEVGYDFEGLQPHVPVDPAAKLVSTKGCVKITPSQNSQSLRTAADSVNGTAKPPVKWTVHRDGSGGGSVSFASQGVSAVHMPALDVAASEAGFIEVMMDAADVQFDGFFRTTAEEKRAIKASKNWLPSNFRCSLDDLPIDQVSRVSSFSIRQGAADLDGDGAADFVITEAIKLTIPVEVASPFSAWFYAGGAGVAAPKMLAIEYRDTNKKAVLTVIIQVELESLGYADLFLGIAEAPGREVQVALKARGIITIRSSGSAGKAGK